MMQQPPFQQMYILSGSELLDKEEAKAKRNKIRRLNVEFQRAARKDKEIYRGRVA